MENKSKILKTINEQNKEYNYTSEDYLRMVSFAKQHPFKLNFYLPTYVALWIEQLQAYIDNSDERSYKHKCEQITEKGFGFLIPIMEEAYGKKLFG